MESAFLSTEIQFIEVLVIASIVAIVAQRFKLPYTVALVIAGLGIALQGQLQIEMTPELVLLLFVPPLLFEAALHIEFSKLRADLVPILTMAIPGVLISTALIGWLLSAMGVLSLPVALLFGALISATDPVAVVATFRAVGAPKRLTTLVEGESLLNDGTAVVIFGIMLELVRHGELSILGGIQEFLFVAVGGSLIGLVLGYVVAQIIARIDDYLIEISLTTILAYGSFLAAESFHVSGVLAVVVAGLVNGNLGPRGMSPTTRIVLFNFWEYVAFLANSFIFILIGMNVEFSALAEFLVPSLIAVVVVLVARATNVYGLGAIIRVFQPNLHTSYLHVMFWGGLRGAISLALVLSLQADIAVRDQLQAMAFAVVLFTLLIQATTTPTLLKRLGFTHASSAPIEYERLQAELLSTKAAGRHIDRLYREGALIPAAWESVKEELATREQELNQETRTLLDEHPEFEREIVNLARMESLRAQRAALEDLAHDEMISSDVVAELKAELDEAIDSPEEVSAAVVASKQSSSI